MKKFDSYHLLESTTYYTTDSKFPKKKEGEKNVKKKKLSLFDYKSDSSSQDSDFCFEINQKDQKSAKQNKIFKS